eukprot:8184896-Lingulodinium_polyedra.AAC.1
MSRHVKAIAHRSMGQVRCVWVRLGAEACVRRWLLCVASERVVVNLLVSIAICLASAVLTQAHRQSE